MKECGFIVVTAPNKRSGQRYMFNETFARTARVARERFMRLVSVYNDSRMHKWRHWYRKGYKVVSVRAQYYDGQWKDAA